MSVVASLLLIRHGESLANVAFPLAHAQGRLESGLTGRDTDVELTDTGAQQAAAVGKWLAEQSTAEHPQTVITSPYLRAKETWRIAAESAGLDLPTPTTDDRLVDRLLGELELLTRAAIDLRFPDEQGRRAEVGEYRYTPPGGESFADIGVRLTSFLDDINQAHADERMIVVAHDAVVLMMRAVIERLSWDQVMAVHAAAGSVRNASLTSFAARDGRLELVSYNSVDHLASTTGP